MREEIGGPAEDIARFDMNGGELAGAFYHDQVFTVYEVLGVAVARNLDAGSIRIDHKTQVVDSHTSEFRLERFCSTGYRALTGNSPRQMDQHRAGPDDDRVRSFGRRIYRIGRDHDAVCRNARITTNAREVGHL